MNQFQPLPSYGTGDKPEPVRVPPKPVKPPTMQKHYPRKERAIFPKHDRRNVTYY